MNFNRLRCGAEANFLHTPAENPVLTVHSSALGFPVDHGETVDFCCQDASRGGSWKRDGVRMRPGDVPRPELVTPPVAEALESATTAGGKVNLVAEVRADDAPGRHSRLEIVSLPGSHDDVTRMDT